MIINILPGKGTDAPEPGDEIACKSHQYRWIIEHLSKTNNNAALLTENLLTITEEINAGKGTVGSY
jgi:phospholipid/cholesterol/gamma-HCH transport system substrate-binding protein